ncbi:hypothetical protein OUZ56_028290 [Daphnia magna]|uniref:Uncharacterized protein n=1 Tax=Daphnia magna TaxID=35525 RepID=A0ABR0B3G0_9CRUS|nr:hypothetical protein OUZ56_028290 [Daphnia magna]
MGYLVLTRILAVPHPDLHLLHHLHSDPFFFFFISHYLRLAISHSFLFFFSSFLLVLHPLRFAPLGSSILEPNLHTPIAMVNVVRLRRCLRRANDSSWSSDEYGYG